MLLLQCFRPHQVIGFSLHFVQNLPTNSAEEPEIFMGLWLLPFGYLVFKSDFLPKVFGILLIAGCFGYLIDFIGGAVLTNYADTSISNYVTLPATVGEIGICLWLLIIGVNESKIPVLSARNAA